MQVLGPIVLIGLGLLQIAATISGLELWLGIPSILAVFLALPFAWMPLLGTAVGAYGAVSAWGWSWAMAGALFFGPFLVALVAILVSGGINAASNR